MRKNKKILLLSTLILTMLAVTLVAQTNSAYSPVRPLRKVRVFITQVNCIGLPQGGWFSLTLYPTYLRPFGGYGDEFTSNSNCGDMSGGSFLYPPGISSGTHVYYNNLYCDWSLCMDFTQNAIYCSGEIKIKYKLRQHKLWGRTEYITILYNTYSYDTEYITTLHYGMGVVKVYITFQLLS